MMTLSELLTRLEDQRGEGVIYIEKVRPRSGDSSVLILPEGHDPNETARAHGDYEYLLEIFLAEEVIQVWREWRDNREPNAGEKCEAVLYYSANDAYLPK